MASTVEASQREMTSELENRLQDFDGVAVSILFETRADCRNERGFLEELLRLVANTNPNVSLGATWILKAEADKGTRFDDELPDMLLNVLADISHWQAKLHILQSVEAFEFDKKQARGVFDWAASLAEHTRPFVRAWSLNARVVTGMKYGDFFDETLEALSVAESDSAASVRARARNLWKRILNSQRSCGRSS